MEVKSTISKLKSRKLRKLEHLLAAEAAKMAGAGTRRKAAKMWTLENPTYPRCMARQELNSVSLIELYGFNLYLLCVPRANERTTRVKKLPPQYLPHWACDSMLQDGGVGPSNQTRVQK